MDEKSLIKVITIDGPSGTGKGTLCAMLANYLGWNKLDSGVIYRILALEVMQESLDLSQEVTLAERALKLDFRFGAAGEIFYHDKEVSQTIRMEECGQMASKISAIAMVRDALVARQRAFLQAPGLVTDGRDMGTVIFPQADLKFFLTADAKERARRRCEQLKNQKICVSLAQVENELLERDRRDSSRAFSPLKPADDAIIIDTTTLTVNEVYALMLREVYWIR